MNFTIAILTLAMLNFSCPDRSGSDSVVTEKWSLIEYHYSRGTVSPEYQYSYDVIISDDGSCVYSFRKGEEKFMETFTVSETQLEELNDLITSSGILSDEVSSLPDSEIPDGGSRQWMILIIENPDPNLDQPPRKIEIPVYPERKFKEHIEGIYSKINELIPDNLKQQN